MRPTVQLSMKEPAVLSSEIGPPPEPSLAYRGQPVVSIEAGAAYDACCHHAAPRPSPRASSVELDIRSPRGLDAENKGRGGGRDLAGRSA